jgi:hypothetical protein
MRIALCSNEVALVAACLALAACGSDALPKPQELGPLRVLGLSADKPEANEGDAVTITPIVSDYSYASESGARALDYAWEFCADPGIAFGASPICGSTILSGSGSIPASEAPLNTPIFSGAVEAARQISVTVPAGILAAVSSAQASNGVALLFTYTLSAGSDSARAFRRIIVTSRTGAALNGPVSISSITGLVAGTPLTFPTEKSDLTPVLASSAESYTVVSSTGATLTRTEKLTVSWYTTDGEFEFSRTDGDSSNSWTPPDSGTPLGLAILRDDRGAVSLPIEIGF